MSEYLPATSESKFSSFSYLINNNFYDFRVFIGSFDGRLRLIRPSAVKMLSIEDSLDNPFHQGYIVLDNSQDVLESSYEESTDQSSPEYYIPNYQDTSKTNNAYMFNGDCRDVLVVQIIPKLSVPDVTIDDQNVLKYFLLKFDFVIYNSEEIVDNSQDGKLKKLYFWELDYEVMREKNSYFSTANYVKAENVSDLSNDERSILTGSALSACINEGLDRNDGFSPVFANFESGSTKIFYSSPGNYKYVDSINFILDRHVSSLDSNFSPSVLQHDRYPKTYSLVSYYNIFKNAVNFESNKMLAGFRYIETFKIAGFNRTSQDNLPRFNVQFVPAFAPYFQSEGNLDVYSFDTIAGAYSQSKINSKPVHSYDYGSKEFDIDFYRNSIEEFSKAAFNNYVKPFGPQGVKTFQTGIYRDSNKNISNEFSPIELDKNQRLALGLGKNLYNYVYLNNFVTFRVQGSTHRQAGDFIGITRETDKQPTVFDKRFLGVYLIVNVKHMFQDATYTNELVCVKTYLPQDMFLNKVIL
jgi:hypothetical protein